ncbi:plasmid pRiA4b ORF-3 family protein [Deinococcus misasensis]|uniref:plasmid pRiA4b ORF-3 family protein n=1 Tax=Deinococcus misasensis TaxID=392413 RepID=UPI00054D2FEB|nr:plasmid pRiA4b ORF-3 family protein [Deinococcus misasensis]
MLEVTSPQVYQSKAILQGITPMIWRRFTVPDTLLLPQPHMVLQTLMGWENIHLYTFHIYGSTYGSASGGAFSDIPIKQFRFQPREKMLYTYDSSEFPRSTSWELELRLERISTNVPAEKRLCCLDGTRRGPLEDLGGPAGYRQWLLSRYSDEALKPLIRMAEIVDVILEQTEGSIRDHIDLDELQDLRDQLERWHDEDPKHFDLAKVNQNLQDRWASRQS